MLKRTRLFGQKMKVTFSLPLDHDYEAISVVGSFNNWEPGRHQLEPRRNGTRTVSVVLPPGEHRFRYLATGDHWFDDHSADHVDHEGSLIRL